MAVTEEDLRVRVAVLETEQRTLVREVRQLRETDEEMNDKLDQLLAAHTKYKGFIGGVMLMVSLVSSAIGIAVAVIKSKFLGG